MSSKLTLSRRFFFAGNVKEASKTAESCAPLLLERSDAPRDVVVAMWCWLGNVREAMGQLAPATEAFQWVR